MRYLASRRVNEERQTLLSLKLIQGMQLQKDKLTEEFPLLLGKRLQIS